MPDTFPMNNPSEHKAYIITGPTSGIGLSTALELARHGVVVLVAKQAKMADFRGGRYISAEASARGEWESGRSKMPGADAYATSKQCTLQIQSDNASGSRFELRIIAGI
jgi:NAD(P)-dependent dehydrogenase (short-subunit alcohol dehydrogenase family)